jgi:hypothetical protein
MLQSLYLSKSIATPTKKDKTFEMMIGRYKKLSEEDFKKMIERQVSAFKASRAKSEEDELEEILNELA